MISIPLWFIIGFFVVVGLCLTFCFLVFFWSLGAENETMKDIEESSKWPEQPK